MSLQLIEGFDVGDLKLKGVTVLHANSAQTNGYSRWVYDASAGATPFGTGRSLRFLQALVNSTAAVVFPVSPAQGSAIKQTFGFWFRRGVPLSAGGNTVYFFSINSGTTAFTGVELSVAFDPSSGRVSIWRGLGTTLLGISGPTQTLDMDTWTFVEVQAVLSPTVGSIAVRLNGTPVVSFSGNTQQSNSFMSSFQLLADYNGAQRATHWYDDLYWLNDQGSANLTWLGPTRVQTLLPSGAGTDTQLTPKGSVSNWQNASDAPYDPTRFNYGSVVGNRDLYALSDLDGATTTVYGVRDNLIANAGGDQAAVIAAADAVTSAPDLSAGGTILSGIATWDNSAATSGEAGEPLLLGAYTNIVWHKVLVPVSGTTAVFQHATDDYGDTFMGLFTGPAGAGYVALTLVNTDDNTAGDAKATVGYTTTVNNQWLYIAHTQVGSTRTSGPMRLLWRIGAVANVGLRFVLRSAGSNYYDAAGVFTYAPSVASAVRETDPATSAAWTVSGINALEAGAEIS